MNALKLYNRFRKKYGPQNWWPIYIEKESKNELKVLHGLTYGISHGSLLKYKNVFRDPYFEIAIGTILAQNVSWKNAAAAIINLYHLKSLNPKKILETSKEKIETALIPTRYYKQKTRSIIEFSGWVRSILKGNILNLRKYKLPEIRKKLLDQRGIGFETADSIMLYSLNLPIFVIDVYTKRVCETYGIKYKKYDDYRYFFEEQFKIFPKAKQVKIYRELHAFFVIEGQNGSLNRKVDRSC